MALASRGTRSVTRTGHRPNELLSLGVVAVVVIWLAVVLVSIFAPDMISGAQQDHVPIAALLTWIWGLIATRSLVTTLIAARARPERIRDARVLVSGIVVVWISATLFGIFGPETVTGSDPTHLPVSAIIAPIIAMVLTTTACQLFSSLHGERRDGDRGPTR